MQVFLQFYVLFLISCFVLFSPPKAILTDNILKTILSLILYSVVVRIMAGAFPRLLEFFSISVFAIHLLFTPAAYLYVRNRVYHISVEKSDRIHLIPFLVFCLVIAGASIFSGGAGTLLNSNWILSDSFFNRSTAILNALIFGVTAFYFALSLLVIRHKMATATGGFSLNQSGSLIINNGYNGHSFPQETTDTQSTVATRHALLTEERIRFIGEAVSKLFEDKKPFLQPRYSLKDLSEDTQIPLHHLSAYINKHCGKNFNDFINEFRVKYCQEKIINQECRNKKLEAVAEESGFNNRNTFAIAFKKVVGINPSQFLKEVKCEADVYNEMYENGEAIAFDKSVYYEG